MNGYMRVLLFCGAGACAVPCAGNQAVQASDGLEIKPAQEWKTEKASGGIRLTAADGAQYLLKSNVFGPGDFGDPVRSSKLQAVAFRLAFGVASGASYAGVKSVAAPDGMQAALFRFRTQGDLLIEVYYVGSASHHAGITTIKPGSDDHTFDLGEMLKSIKFGPASSSAQPLSQEATPQPARAEPQSKAPDPARIPFAVPALEVYSGKVNSSDVSFELRIRDEKVATATWEKTVGTEVRWQGTYSGKEGNYLVKLDRSGAVPSPGGRLIIAIRSQGAVVSGKWIVGGETPRHDMADIKLTEVVEHGEVPFKKGGVKATNNTTSASNRATRNTRSAVRRVINRNRRKRL